MLNARSLSRVLNVVVLVDADFETRAVTGKPGIAYKCLGSGKFQMRILDSRILED